MSNWDIARLSIALILVLILLVILLTHNMYRARGVTIELITRTAIFSTFAVILYVVPLFQFALPIFPTFLEIHLDEIPALIAGFAYGPGVGFMIILIKTIIKIPFSTTLAVGELADFIYGVVFVVPAAMYYKRHRSFKGCVVASLIGVLFQVVVASFITSWPILDFYMFVMGFTEDQILYLCQLVNPNVTSLGFTFLLWVALPFNLLKDAIVVVLTWLLYKRLHTFIDKRTERKVSTT